MRFLALVCLLCLSGAPVISAQEAVKLDCKGAYDAKEELNSALLFDAYKTCTDQGQDKRAALLLVIGQIRFMTDTRALKPSGDNESSHFSRTYVDFYFKHSALGAQDLYRDQAFVSDFVEAIGKANLALTPEYDPGWIAEQSVSSADYEIIVKNVKEIRIWQIGNYALLQQNDEYYAAQKQLDELRKTTSVFRVGTAEYDEYQRLNGMLSEASRTVETLPRPTATEAYKRLTGTLKGKPVMNAGIGFNGPLTSSINFFTSEADVRLSWLSKAYSSEELDRLISKINFEAQLLLSFNFGKRMNASGKINVQYLVVDVNGYKISTEIGVVPKECGETFKASYPFVLTVVGAIAKPRAKFTGSSNFGDDCGPVKSSQSVENQ